MYLKIRINAAEKVRRMIDDLMEVGTFVPAILAHDLVTRLREEDPALLEEWLDLHAEELMRNTVNTIIRARRTYARHNASKSVFANAVQRAEAGEPALLEGFLEQQFTVNADHTRKRLADMYKEEVLYASQMFNRLARSHQMQAAFLRVIADKIGARSVGDTFDNDQLNSLWRRLDS